MPITKLAEKRAFKVRANLISPDEDYYSFKLATGQTVNRILNTVSGDDTALLTAAGVSATASAGAVFKDDSNANVWDRNARQSFQAGAAGNFLVGSNAGESITTGDYNIAIGDKALQDNETLGYQVAIGTEAAADMTAQSSPSVFLGGYAARFLETGNGGNVAIGYQAGYGHPSNAVTYGFGTLVGLEAGKTLETGNYNVVMGYKAGNTLTSGANNTIVGSLTMGSNQTSSNHVAIGYNSAYDVTAQSNPSVFIGYETARYLETGNGNNVVIGDQAGYGNNTDAITYDYSVLLGSDAGHSITTANGNVAIGHEAFYYNETGDYNVVIGYQAGKTTATYNYLENVFIGKQAALNNQGGSVSVVIGSEAMQNNTTGSGNVVIGYQAGKGSSAGAVDSSVLIGRQAGEDISTGDSNVAIGYIAMSNNRTGQYNVCIGRGAGNGTNTNSFSNTTFVGGGAGAANEADSNTAIGYFAGASNTTGIFNTALGYNAGRYNATGSYNTVLGYRAGGGSNSTTYTNEHNTNVGSESGLNIRVGSYNTFLGSQTGEGVVSGGSNVMIGYEAGQNVGDVSNKLIISNTNTLTPLISGDFARNFVKIGGSLEISGGVRVDEFSNDASMTDASSAALVTEYAAKNYVDQAIISGVYTLPQAPSATVSFSTTLSDTNYTVTGDVENTTDIEPSIYSFTTISKTVSGFTIRLSGTPDSANYKLNYQVKNTAAGVVVDGVGFFTDQEHSWTKQQYAPYNEITLDGGTPSAAWNLSNNQFVVVNLDANGGILNPTNMPSPGIGSYLMIVKSSGSYTLTFDSAYLWESGTPPTITDTGTDVLSFVSDGTYMYGSYSQAYA